jgi:hypothetical protein
MYHVKSDGSIEDNNGKVIYFSTDRFIADIVEGDCCFICGRSPNQTTFNNEHILPKWILNKYNLFNRRIGLPNYSLYRYDRYIIPCCMDCNALMNTKIERPIKKIIGKGYTEIIKYIENNGPWLFFVWLSLIYLKTHLKDKLLKQDIKSEVNSSIISDPYDWVSFHHIHCIARSFYTNPIISNDVLGSLIILPSKVSKDYESYDYRDLYLAKSLFIRLGEITFIAALNDSCSSLSYVSKFVKKIDGYISPLQARELLARLAFANIILKNRPEFYSDINLLKEEYSIQAKVSNYLEFDEPDELKFGKLMYSCCADILAETVSPSGEPQIDFVKKGIYTFILDQDGNFIKNSMEIINKPSNN